MLSQLTDIEARVLGSLIEKDITTPDYYPLSVNALVNACNQKNNREPVMSLGEDAVRQALTTLQEKRLAGPTSGANDPTPVKTPTRAPSSSSQRARNGFTSDSAGAVRTPGAVRKRSRAGVSKSSAARPEVLPDAQDSARAACRFGSPQAVTMGCH